MTNTNCSVPGCERPLKQKSFCYAHYMKNWRYGTPTPVRPPRWKDIRGERFGTLVVTERVDGKWFCVCDCGVERVVPVGELNRTGGRMTCGTQGAHLRADSGYGAAHWRVHKKYGPASDYRCIDCGVPASQWSYDHADPDELTAYVRSRNLAAYSLNPEHYDPRCIPCHKRFDLDRNAYITRA